MEREKSEVTWGWTLTKKREREREREREKLITKKRARKR